MLESTDQWVIASMVEDGVLDASAATAAAALSAERRIGLLDALVESGRATRRDVTIGRAVMSESIFVALEDYDIDIRNAHLLPRAVAERCCAFPLFDLGHAVTIGMADPQDLAAADQVRAALRAEADFVLCEPKALQALIARAYSLVGDVGAAGPAVAASADRLITGEEPIVAAVNQILSRAAEENASDVHISPDESELQIRYRIDGMLHSRHGPQRSAHGAIVQRLKVMASLDLTQSRRPQDGKFRFSDGARTVDVRVSIVPTIHGENAVLRLLAPAASIRTFAELGMGPEMRRAVEELTDQPHGIFLVTGPTGSGKTTTLYTAIKRICTPDRNILTIEDPVEIRLPGVRQVQVTSEIGLTFAHALRAILRQDPDVVLLGEIRDEETARTALQAALTGHLVLSTLHTNDAPGAVARLRDLGCPTFAINAALLGAMAQRLVRRVCPSCAKPQAPSSVLSRRFSIAAGETGFVKGSGCGVCLSTGYRGRLGMMELIRVTPELQARIDAEAGIAEVRRQAMADGMKPMWRDGVEKARLGMTTLEEVARAASVEFDEAEEPSARHPDAMRLSA